MKSRMKIFCQNKKNMFGRCVWIEMVIKMTILFQKNGKFDSNLHILNSFFLFLK